MYAAPFLERLSAEVAIDLPVVTDILPAAPGILAVTVRSGSYVPGRQDVYRKEAGDEIIPTVKTYGGIDVVTKYAVKRNGAELGSLVGGENGTVVYFGDTIVGEKLDATAAALPSNYRIESVDDPRFSRGLAPTAVYVKSKPFATAADKLAMEHRFYLHLPYELRAGVRYTIKIGNAKVANPVFDYLHDPFHGRSEAVHTTQIGFAPGDLGKRAYLSLWLGTGAGWRFPENIPFSIVEEGTDTIKYTGTAKLAFPADSIESVVLKKNYNLADVYHLDFEDFREPGNYRIYVKDVGCGYSFTIGGNVWENAFKTAMKGFFHVRSGIALEKPYTDYVRPRPYHPADGMKVYQSSTTLLDTKNGLNARGTDTSNFGNLLKGRTEELVEDAWGGYFDAGDWDRRIQHLEVTRLHLELLMLNPSFFDRLNMSIPESSNRLPDILDEALWNLELYRRLQLKNGGIRGGIEAASHPRSGEASWQESLPVMAYAPDHWSSYVYAGVAARAAGLLQGRNDALAEAYRSSALAAMEWAEKEYPVWLKDPNVNRSDWKVEVNVRDARNLAAAEVYRLTGDNRWHTIFLSTTVFKDPESMLFQFKHHDQTEAAFVYANTTTIPVETSVRLNCRNAIIREADFALSYEDGNAFNIAAREPGKPPLNGYFTVSDAKSMIRAHHLTGEAKYLRGVVRSTQFGAGANPSNVVYTTGVGKNPVKYPLHVESHNTGMDAPEGITVYGPRDVRWYKDHWIMKRLLNEAVVPHPTEWPTADAYFDLYPYVELNEWTIQQTMGPNSYVWGYLAGR